MSASPFTALPEPGTGPVLSGVIGWAIAGADARARAATVAQYACAWELSQHVATKLDVAACDAFASLAHVPTNTLSLLASPQGWTVLAGYIAGDLGLPIPDFKPTVH